MQRQIGSMQCMFNLLGRYRSIVASAVVEAVTGAGQWGVLLGAALCI